MLIRFSAGNHLSMREPQELSLVASSLKDDEGGLIKCGRVPGGKLLPAAVVYGANASGKSNFVSALEFMRDAILYSHSRGEPEGGIPRLSFALDPECNRESSVFEADFVVEGVRYFYGFECTDKAFETEWLYAFPSSRKQVLFERSGGEFKFGRGLRGRKDVIADLTRPNSLFLSAAVQNHHKHLSVIVSFFRGLIVDTRIVMPGNYASLTLMQGDVDPRVIRFLEAIGTGVFDYRRRQQDTSEQEKAFIQAIDKAIRETLDPPPEFNIDHNEISVELAHRGQDGEPVYFDLARESAGTRRLLVVLSRVFNALDNGAAFVIDELDASLHTQACEALLTLFSSPKSNPKGAQLIATTHDTNLMRFPLLRRDQVWLCEKDQAGATHIYPLTDIRTRKGDNIEKGYLQGRYGAIPFAGSILDLVAA